MFYILDFNMLCFLFELQRRLLVYIIDNQIDILFKKINASWESYLSWAVMTGSSEALFVAMVPVYSVDLGQVGSEVIQSCVPLLLKNIFLKYLCRKCWYLHDVKALFICIWIQLIYLYNTTIIPYAFLPFYATYFD